MAVGTIRIWNAAMLRPFFKGDGISVRPVICGEALFKFAMAVCFAACSKQIARGLGRDQYGSRKQDGAGQMVAQVSAALTLAPEDVVVCTDAKNAFGSILRSTLWRSALDACPKLAGVMQPLIGAGAARMWRSKKMGATNAWRCTVALARGPREYASLLPCSRKAMRATARICTQSEDHDAAVDVR